MNTGLPAVLRFGAGRRSTRWRIALAFAGLALVLFLLVGAVTSRQAFRQVEGDHGRALRQVAGNLADSLDVGMFERFREIQNLAGLELLIESRFEPERWRSLVESLRGSFPHYAWIGVANGAGRVVAATGGLLLGADVGSRPWYVQGRKQPFVGDVHEALLLARLLPPNADGEPLRLVDFAAPITRDGQGVGVLGAHLSWAWAEELRRSALRGDTASRQVELVVVDGAGRWLLGPGGAQKGVVPRGELPTLLHEGPGIVEWSDGVSYVTAAVPTRGHLGYPGLGWTVLARQPVDEAMAAAQHLRWQIWSIGAVGAALFGTIGWWMAGLLTARLRRIAQHARTLAPGSKALAGGRGAGDEVAQLADSLGTLVTQLRQRERELLSLNETLEARVAQRTSALVRANEDLQSFSRNVAHDLKGPIGALGGLVRLLVERSRDPASPDAREMLLAIGTECDRLVQLVDELMTLSQVEQKPLRAGPVAMSAMAQSVADELLARPGAPQAEVLIGSLPDAIGDAVLLRQVWHNLIANALKFSARAEAPRIVIGAQHAGTECYYRVQDNGVGFDPAQASRLYGVFQRLHEPSDFPGTGVGLSIVKRVVHRHQGRVGAVSRPGEGAQFWFVLPCAEPEPEPEAREVRQEQAEAVREA